MKAIVNAMFVVVLAVIMVTASALFTAGYPSIYAKKSSDSSSGSGSSGSGGSGSSGSSNGKSNPESSPPKDEQNGKTTMDNPPVTAEPVTPSSPSNTGDNAGACVVGGGPPCNPEQRPQQPTPPTNGEAPDQDCLFNPSLSKCKSDNGKCPDGFFQNEDGNCFPKHDKCPSGFHSHENDETGRCIPDSTPCEPGFIRNPDFPTCNSKDSVCRDHPELRVCGGNGGGIVKIIIIIKNIIHKNSRGSSHSSQSLNTDCINVIKLAWENNIHRGQDKQVDQYIDRCLSVVK